MQYYGFSAQRYVYEKEGNRFLGKVGGCLQTTWNRVPDKKNIYIHLFEN
jgi:hypothetical protein